jgi:hypothetical protein
VQRVRARGVRQQRRLEVGVVVDERIESHDVDDEW